MSTTKREEPSTKDPTYTSAAQLYESAVKRPSVLMGAALAKNGRSPGYTCLQTTTPRLCGDDPYPVTLRANIYSYSDDGVQQGLQWLKDNLEQAKSADDVKDEIDEEDFQVLGVIVQATPRAPLDAALSLYRGLGDPEGDLLTINVGAPRFEDLPGIISAIEAKAKELGSNLEISERNIGDGYGFIIELIAGEDDDEYDDEDE